MANFGKPPSPAKAPGWAECVDVWRRRQSLAGIVPNDRFRYLCRGSVDLFVAPKQGCKAMRISGLTLHGEAGWPELESSAINPGLNVVYGPPASGKTAVADFLGHALFGKRPAAISGPQPRLTPAGEAVVESGDARYRLRRYHDGTAGVWLTVAALDGSPVDQGTIGSLVGGLSPTVLAPLCAISFREPADIGSLLSPEFAREFQAMAGGNPAQGSRRMVELVARRDALAHELETRLASDRRVSKDLDARWRELDRLLRDEQQQASALDERLHAVETALAETDARLRYRRLELNVELRWQTAETSDWEAQLADLDDEIARWRTTLADLAQREASVRARLAQIQPADGVSAAAVTDQQAWLAVARQLAGDLAGEVARLARASASRQCVCRDAHPRLRPIAETIQRQLDVLESLIDEQQRSFGAAELHVEVDHLGRSQAELRRQLEHLLDRRHGLVRRAKPGRRPAVLEQVAETVACRDDLRSDADSSCSAADVEQLEQRRMELEQERFELVERLRTHGRKLRDLRAQRDTVDRQRAALLSARSIEHVQRELAAVQQKLERAANADGRHCETAILSDDPVRASDYLAQLTNGGLVRLQLVEQGRWACVVNRAGNTVSIESLTAAERDQVYLSLCLALHSAAARQGVWLPLVLDDPFARLDASGTAALAAVLDEFSRQGHQVLVFTGQPAAAERLTSLGAPVHDITHLRRRERHELAPILAASQGQLTPPRPGIIKKPKGLKRKTREKRPKNGQLETLGDSQSTADQIDAA